MAGASLFHVGEDVEFWRVLVHLSVLAAFLTGFEYALHRLEHRLAQHDKFYQILQKVYRELMILGLISLVLKILKEVAPIDGSSKPMIAFQVADLVIFGLAIALILQTVYIFLRLQKQGERQDQAELITTKCLVDGFHTQNTTDCDSSCLRARATLFFWRWCGQTVGNTQFDTALVKHRLLRHVFLGRFGLPQLFPFLKYLRLAQENQVLYMIEVEPSMWLVLLVVAWGICGLAESAQGFALVKLLAVFAWLVLFAHVVVLIYFRSSIHQLTKIAGYSDDKFVLCANLTLIAEEEVSAWHSEEADSALDSMRQVYELQTDIEHERKSTHYDFLDHDLGFNLVSSLCRRISRPFKPKNNLSFRQSDEALAPPDISIRFFSRQAWHFVIILLMTLNAFFVALFVQCALYNLDEIYNELGLTAAVMVPLPMILSTLTLQQHIFRDFVLICSILHLDVRALGDAISHFHETVEMQYEFAATVLQCLNEGGHSIEYLETVVHSHDVNQSGYIEVNTLRAVLASVGLEFSQFRFISIVKLLFELRGTEVAHAQLFRLLTIVQQEFDQIEQEARLQRAGTLFDTDNGTRSMTTDEMASTQYSQSSAAFDLGSTDFAYAKTGTPTLRRGLTTGLFNLHYLQNESQRRQSMLRRSSSYNFIGSRSRVLSDMYNIRALAYSQENRGSKAATII
ncbi:unnamed protein product [Phytophthora lilii]|uniref:Unnamed protein product n=1 Tax=Phytophthora lilii TaxID=2077276 RepID=A0A9W6WP19_9STRA|nr:unnamed protein product [Phytophthora lilii]